MGAFTTRRQQHRNRGSLMNWRVLTVVAAGLVLALATYSNSWQRQHFGGDPMLRDPMLRTSAAGRGGSGRRSRERTTIERAYGNGDGEHALDAAEGVQQLTSTIDRKRGTAGVLQEGAEGEAARGGAVEAPAKPVPKEPGACFRDQPWIPHALDQFFEHTWRSANESLQTSEESLAKTNNVTWVDGYRPGHDEITLRWDDGAGKYVLDINEVAKPNLRYKKDCILEILKAAVEVHNEELGQVLKKRPLKFLVATEDFGLVWRGMKYKLPAFALCTDDSHIDIPVPDFTYACYPETRYKNSSWPAIRELLTRKSQMVDWRDRRNDIFHRSHWGVGPRQKLMPMFKAFQDNGTDEKALGAKMNVGDTGFSPHLAKRDTYVWLDNQCDHRYQIHTAGFSYSAGLKYKLACGSLVFKFDSTFKEFYEPALQDGVHVVKLDESTEKFNSETVPKMKAAVEASQADFPAIAARGQEFAMRNLTLDALYCYWYGALVRYSELYFLEKTPAQLKEEQKRSGGAKKEGAAQQRRLRFQLW